MTKGVTQWNFNPSSCKSYCLTFVEVYFNSIFYRSLPLRYPDPSATFLFRFYLWFSYVLESSAKSLILESMFLQISFTYTRNSSGSKTLPCGTPEITFTLLNICPPTLTLYVRRTRNSLIKATTLESALEAANFISSQSWGTKLKALEKSIIIVQRERYVLAHCNDLTLARV